VDAKGRQNYQLFRMGDRELYTGMRLTTAEILRFICDGPPKMIYVGFAFGYDVTMILRDLPASQIARLFAPKVFEPGRSPSTYFGEFNIDYLPRNYLKVSRVKIIRVDGKERRVPIKGSQRIIYETFGFFQKSFLKAVSDFAVATPEEEKIIARNKAARSSFDTITQGVRDYCALECDLLSRLMESLRTYCLEADIRPRTWSGAGKLAAALHDKHSTLAAKDLALPAGLMDMAAEAYYGGRFEITRIGKIEGPVYEADINSAYPAAMPGLPCLTHGAWREAGPAELRKARGVFVADLSFTHPAPRGDHSLLGSDIKDPHIGKLNGFPIRTKKGSLIWPDNGSGVYWSCEINSAKELGARVKYKQGWIYDQRCDCRPFDWVEQLYEYRKSIGKAGAGYPIKLGINSLYGKLAQRKGNGRFANLVHAGLITAETRAKLNRAVARAPHGSVIMLATDAVFSTARLDLDYGDRLGEWDVAELSSLFVVQPGIYWDPARRKRKSRGLSGKFFEEPGRTESFEAAWEDFREADAPYDDMEDVWQADMNRPRPPIVSVPLTTFTGIKLAHARGKPEAAGTWVHDTRKLSFDWTGKRDRLRVWQGASVLTAPKVDGGRSLPHRALVASGRAGELDEIREQFSEMPDHVDLGPPEW